MPPSRFDCFIYMKTINLCLMMDNSLIVEELHDVHSRLIFNPPTKTSSRLRPATLVKKSLWHRCFPVNFWNF